MNGSIMELHASGHKINHGGNLIVRGSSARSFKFCPKMIHVPGGIFEMGSMEHFNELPIRIVKISSFKLGQYEVTNEEYRAYLEATKQNIPELIKDVTFNLLPVGPVLWSDAVNYCNWLSKETGRKFRLPTEAEWEYAARGSKSLRYPWGDMFNPSKFSYISSSATRVDAYPKGKSWCGIHDMSGNVSEWTQDWYADKYAPLDVNDPLGPVAGTYKVIRGGFQPNLLPESFRGATRFKGDPAVYCGLVGFRIAEDI